MVERPVAAALGVAMVIAECAAFAALGLLVAYLGERTALEGLGDRFFPTGQDATRAFLAVAALFAVAPLLLAVALPMGSDPHRPLARALAFLWSFCLIGLPASYVRNPSHFAEGLVQWGEMMRFVTVPALAGALVGLFGRSVPGGADAPLVPPRVGRFVPAAAPFLGLAWMLLLLNAGRTNDAWLFLAPAGVALLAVALTATSTAGALAVGLGFPFGWWFAALVALVLPVETAALAVVVGGGVAALGAWAASATRAWWRTRREVVGDAPSDLS